MTSAPSFVPTSGRSVAGWKPRRGAKLPTPAARAPLRGSPTRTDSAPPPASGRPPDLHGLSRSIVQPAARDHPGRQFGKPRLRPRRPRVSVAGGPGGPGARYPARPGLLPLLRRLLSGANPTGRLLRAQRKGRPDCVLPGKNVVELEVAIDGVSRDRRHRLRSRPSTFRIMTPGVQLGSALRGQDRPVAVVDLDEEASRDGVGRDVEAGLDWTSRAKNVERPDYFSGSFGQVPGWPVSERGRNVPASCRRARGRR